MVIALAIWNVALMGVIRSVLWHQSLVQSQGSVPWMIIYHLNCARLQKTTVKMTRIVKEGISVVQQDVIWIV